MPDSIQAVGDVAMKPSPKEHEQLFERLIASLDRGDVLHPDWHDEIARRMADLQPGRARLIPADEAMARMTAHIHARRPAA
ncbi:MAG: addiction module protein [Burkholderiaceae bacterium]|nr:addiction module protein [Burkholderiaceae bacterium]